jgi:DNA-binding transcriptional LysR family regulator
LCIYATKITMNQPHKRRAVLGQISDADIRLLRVFQAVVDCGGMTAAELELNISTSTISRHVKDLETRLGLTLCRRGRSGFSLTPEGERIHAETRQLLLATQSFRASVDDLHHRLGGVIHVAVFDKTASNPEAHIAQAVSLFRRQAPDVILNLHVGTIQAIERGVIEGAYQLGIIPEHRRSDSLVYEELFGESMQLYCAQGHPFFEQTPAELAWSDVRAHAFAGLGYHSPNMEVSHRERLQRSATAFDQESVATFILSGDFLGFLPDHYAHGFVQSGWMRAVCPAQFNYQCHFSAITRQSPEPTRATRIFQQCLTQAHQQAPARAGNTG